MGRKRPIELKFRLSEEEYNALLQPVFQKENFILQTAQPEKSFPFVCSYHRSFSDSLRMVSASLWIIV